MSAGSGGAEPGRARYVGDGPSFSEIWIRRDAEGRHWLHVHYEAEQYTAAGHWYEALLDDGTDLIKITVADVDDIFRRSAARFCGGSFFDGKVTPCDGPPKRLI
jgi:hypothetical protein